MPTDISTETTLNVENIQVRNDISLSATQQWVESARNDAVDHPGESRCVG